MKVKMGLKKYGFTLGELLITLGIIGVIAALTIPTLIQNANERATITALKKAYATLANAYKLAEQENGTPDTWGLVAGADSPPMLGNLAPYLSVAKSCLDGSAGCWPPGVQYKRLAASAGVYGNDSWTYPKLKLADGTQLMGEVWSSTCAFSKGPTLSLKNICGTYWVDVNGYKGPNQWGKDTFWIYLTKYGIIPGGSPPDIGYSFAAYCKDKDSMGGFGCAAWVIYNENMDYLHCDYLDWNGAKECN